MKRMKPARPSASLGAYDKRKRLDVIARLIEDEDWSEAESRLADYLAAFPDDKQAHMLKAQLAIELEDEEVSETETTWLVQHHPNCRESHELWVESAANTGMYAVAIQRMHMGLEKWPVRLSDDELMSGIRELEKMLRKEIETFTAIPPNWLELTAAKETAHFLCDNFKYDEAINVCMEALKLSPGFVPLTTTLAHCRFEAGEIDAARGMYSDLIESSRNPLFALGGLVRCAVLSGQMEEARALTRRMRERCDDKFAPQIANCLTLTGEFDCMCDYYEELAAKSIELSSDVLHFAATAYARCGDTIKAEQLWKRALNERPGLTEARDNLKDLRAPAASRVGAWSHSTYSYMPGALWHDLWCTIVGGIGVKSDELKPLMEEWPELLTVAPALLEQGDEIGRTVALSLMCGDSIRLFKDQLTAFAGGKNGTDEQRVMVYYILGEAACLNVGVYPLWYNGTLLQLPVSEFRALKGMANLQPDETDTLISKGHKALQEHRHDDALRYFERARETSPDSPTARNNIGAVYKAMGNEQKYIEIISDLYDDFPDYVFARTNMAGIQMDAGNLEAARHIMTPLAERDSFRPSEIEAVYTTLIRLAVQEGDLDELERWVTALERDVPSCTLIDELKPALQQMRAISGKKPKKANKTNRAGEQSSLF